MLKSEVFNLFKTGNINVFQAIRILETNIENKKNKGVVYTPKYIADQDNLLSCRQNNIDIFYAFIELSNNISKRSSMIVPNSLISNKSAVIMAQR